jgi:hypothetical protein
MSKQKYNRKKTPKIIFLETNLTKKKTSIEDKLINSIKTAKSKIFISTWLLNSDKIKDALLHASKRLKGHIYIISAIEQNYFHYRYSDDEEDYEEYNFATLEALKGKNEDQVAVEIRGHKNAHAKFAIIDDEKVILTSANFTHSSLELTGNQRFHKNEVGLYIKDKNFVKNLSSFFKILYMQNSQAHLLFQESPLIRTPLYIMNKRDFSKEILQYSNSTTLKRFSTGYFFIWTLPDDISALNLEKNLIESSILKIIEDEKDLLNLCSFSWKVEKESLVWNCLTKKLENKTFQCNLIINKPKNGDVNEALIYLKEHYSNFNLFYHPQLHAKFILSKKAWLLCTANFDMEYGLKNSIDVGILSNNPTINTNLSDFFLQMKTESKRQ